MYKERTKSMIQVWRRSPDGTVMKVGEPIPITPASKIVRKLMGEHYIELSFLSVRPVYYAIGDYIDDEIFGRFVIREEQMPSYEQTYSAYRYTLKFDAWYLMWGNKKFMYSYLQSDEICRNEMQWYLTDTLDHQMDVFVRNLYSLGYVKESVTGSNEDGTTKTSSYYSLADSSEIEDIAEAKLMSYSGTDLISALNSLAEAWECEWWVEGNGVTGDKGYPAFKIHLGKCENGDLVDFLVGDGANVNSMTPSKNADTYANKFYVYGSKDNIPYSYRRNLFVKLESIYKESSPTGKVYLINPKLRANMFTKEEEGTGIESGIVKVSSFTASVIERGVKYTSNAFTLKADTYSVKMGNFKIYQLSAQVSTIREAVEYGRYPIVGTKVTIELVKEGNKITLYEGSKTQTYTEDGKYELPLPEIAVDRNSISLDEGNWHIEITEQVIYENTSLPVIESSISFSATFALRYGEDGSTKYMDFGITDNAFITEEKREEKQTHSMGTYRVKGNVGVSFTQYRVKFRQPASPTVNINIDFSLSFTETLRVYAVCGDKKKILGEESQTLTITESNSNANSKYIKADGTECSNLNEDVAYKEIDTMFSGTSIELAIDKYLTTSGGEWTYCVEVEYQTSEEVTYIIKTASFTSTTLLYVERAKAKQQQIGTVGAWIGERTQENRVTMYLNPLGMEADEKGFYTASFGQDVDMSKKIWIDDVGTVRVPYAYYALDYEDPSSLFRVGDTRLRLPQSPQASTDGKWYCKDGYILPASYKDTPEIPQIVDMALSFEKIYPDGKLIISEVYREEKKQVTIYDDNSQTPYKWIQYHLTLKQQDGSEFVFDKDYVLENSEGLKIRFLSPTDIDNCTGTCHLAGMTFGCEFHTSTYINDLDTNRTHSVLQDFAIVRNDDFGCMLPNEVLKPNVGDPVVLVGWNTKAISNTILEDAETRLMQKGFEYAEALEESQFTFECSMNTEYDYRRNGYSLYDIGRKVRIYNDALPVSETREDESGTEELRYKDSRIIGYELKLDKPYDTPRYTVGETDTYSRLKKIEKEITKLSE